MTTPADFAIRVQHVSKQFRLGVRHNEYPTLRESITSGLARAGGTVARLVGRGTSASAERDILSALDDVSFEVRQGETLGIVGSNGAGKSTLLKILARVTEPSSGRAEVRGRLGSLLEVGTGFHQELTGRENVFLNGAILGMRRAEIRQRFDDIVAFAEVERFIDTPVKFYSSGMYLRLAFAVAAHLEPEILLVDEVLAVGDAAFQEKCLGKMEDVADHGRTILFVSHNMTAMEALCDRLIWMKGGRVAADGPTAEVISQYLSTYVVSRTEQRWPDATHAPGNEHIRMRAACVRPRDDVADDVISIATPLLIELEYRLEDASTQLIPNLYLVNSQGTVVFRSAPADLTPWQGRANGRAVIRDRCWVPGNLLNDGTHRVAFSLTRGPDTVYWVDDLLVFDVRDSAEVRNASYEKWAGVVRPMLDWQTQSVPEPSGYGPVSLPT
jgi:lipopolysaccharide transport system ATP-binding protein